MTTADDSVALTTNSGYKFSGANVDSLGASEFTLVHIAVDTSGSVHGMEKQLAEMVGAAIGSCQKSPRKDNMLVRVTEFNTSIHELHGWNNLVTCNPSNYSFKPTGVTVLYEATMEALGAMDTYAKYLQKSDFTCNGILFIVTDGEDYGSNKNVTPSRIKDLIVEMRRKEVLESLLVILIGINDQRLKTILLNFKNEAGLDVYESAGDVNPKSLAKIQGYVASMSVSQANSKGTGTASQILSF